MAMTTDCLVKLRPLVSDEVYSQLDEAFKAGDQKKWDFTMNDSHADMQYLRRGARQNANVKSHIVGYIQAQDAKGIAPQDALLDILSGSGVRQRSGVVPLDKYIEGVRGKYTAMNIDLIDSTRATLMGLSRANNPDFVENLVKGIHGDAGASIPKGGQAIIDAWHRTTKAILERFNKAGGNISELKGFNIPVNHYSPSLIKAGEDAWVTDALNLFDVRKRIDLPSISDEALLRKIYNNIVTEGRANTTFGEEAAKRYKKMGNSHQQFRFLQPKSGAAWLEYNAKYGKHSNPVESMKEYIDSMATEIGMMEILGTNPHTMVADMVAEVKRATGNKRAGDLSIATMDHISSRSPGVDDSITSAFRAVRNIQVVTKLPLSGITAISDVAFMTTRAGYLGMSPVKVFTRHMKNLVTDGDYKTAGRMGLLADYANQRAVAARRYSDSMGSSMLDRVTDFAMRANGLNHWTNSARSTFGLEFLANMADHSVKSFDDMPRGLRSAFERYGFTSDDWAAISKTVVDEKGTKFVDPTSELLDDSIQAKIIGMIKEETNFAVPEPNAKARAIASAGTQTNTVANEMVRTVTQFKSFGVSVLVSNLGVMLDKGLPVGTKLAYATSLVTTTAIMGTLIIQLKDIAKGREPRKVTADAEGLKLVAEGYLQGGSLGVAGDVFFNDPSLFGGLPAYLAGPTVGDAQRIWSVMHKTKDEAMKEGGDWQKVLFPAAEKAAEELAFPLRLWQTRVAMERLMLDQTRRMVDPDYYSKLARTRTWLRNEKGQEYWSEPK